MSPVCNLSVGLLSYYSCGCGLIYLMPKEKLFCGTFQTASSVLLDDMFVHRTRTFLMGRLLSGERKQAPGWEKAEHSALPHHELDSTRFPADMGKQQHIAIFLHSFCPLSVLEECLGKSVGERALPA